MSKPSKRNRIVVEAIGYSHWASYLINNDASGLCRQDVIECDAWLVINDLDGVNCVSCDEYDSFATPDGGALPGHCSLFTFIH